MIVQFLLAWLVDSVLIQHVVELTQHVNSVTNELETVVNCGQESLLNNEFLDVIDRSTQVVNGRLEPILRLVGALLVDFRDHVLDTVVELFWSGLELGLDSFGVKLEQTNVSARGQVRLEVVLVVLEQNDNVPHVLDGVLQTLMNKNVNVKLFVAPVDLQDGLEASQEDSRLLVRALDDIIDALLLSSKEGLVADPAQRVQGQVLLVVELIPLGVTHDVVPLLECVGIDLQIVVLTPADEALDLVQTLLEVTCNLGLEVLRVRFQLDPEVVDVGEGLLVELNLLNLTVVLLLRFILDLFLLKLQMGKQVEVLLLARASGRHDEVINWHLANLVEWDLF